MWYVHLKTSLYCFLENMHEARKSFFDVEIVKCLELNEICCDFKLWNTFFNTANGFDSPNRRVSEYTRKSA